LLGARLTALKNGLRGVSCISGPTIEKATQHVRRTACPPVQVIAGIFPFQKDPVSFLTARPYKFMIFSTAAGQEDALVGVLAVKVIRAL